MCLSWHRKMTSLLSMFSDVTCKFKDESCSMFKDSIMPG